MNEVYLGLEEVLDIALKPGKGQEGDAGLRLELDEDVDVAIGAGVAAGDGAEEGEGPDRVSPGQFRLCISQGLEDLLAVHVGSVVDGCIERFGEIGGEIGPRLGRSGPVLEDL